MKLPNDQGNERDDKGNAKTDDKVRSKPVLFLALIERDLQCAHGDDQQTDADVVDAVKIVPVGLLVRGIFHQPIGEKKRQDAYRNVDVENPVPGIVIGDPSAESWPDGRRQHRNHPVK